MLKIYIFYLVVSIFGFALGFLLGKNVSTDNLSDWIKLLIVAVPVSLALTQSIAIRKDLGSLKETEGLTASERRRLIGVITVLGQESVVGVVTGLTLPFITIYLLVVKSEPSFILGSLGMLWFFCTMLLVRMFHYNSKQIEAFKAYVKNKAEDNKRKKELLDKLLFDKKS